MVSVLADTTGMSREEWLKMRKRGIGGSDVAAICGLSKWKSPMHIYLDKTNPETIDEGIISEPAYWGTVMEDVLAKEFAKRSGYETRTLDKILAHPEHEWAFANVDRVIVVPNENGEDIGILECKTASEYLLGDWKDERIPDYYMVQLQWYLFVTGLSWGYFATLVGGNKFYSIFVERDDTLIDLLTNICHNFWHNNVLAKVPPEFDGSEASSALIKQLYSEVDPESTIELTDEAEPLIMQLLDAKKAVKEAALRETEAENRLKALIQDKELAFFRGRCAFTWKSQSDTRLDTKSLMQDHPEIYEKYLHTKQVRKFLPKVKEV